MKRALVSAILFGLVGATPAGADPLRISSMGVVSRTAMHAIGAELRNGYQNEASFSPMEVIRELEATGMNLNVRNRGWKPNPDSAKKNKDDGRVRQVPEPGSLLLILSGAAAVAAVRSRRKRPRS